MVPVSVLAEMEATSMEVESLRERLERVFEPTTVLDDEGDDYFGLS